MNGKKVARFTGANKRIGFEIGRQLGKLGFSVVLAARDEAKVTAAADRLRVEGLDVQGVRLDVTDPSTADRGSDASPRSVEQGAAIAEKLATMDEPPTGKSLDDAGEIPWVA